MIFYLEFDRVNFSQRNWLEIERACPFLVKINGVTGLLTCTRQGDSSTVTFHHPGFTGGTEKVFLSDLRWTSPFLRNIRKFVNIPFKLS
jgi:hypothetical protein